MPRPEITGRKPLATTHDGEAMASPAAAFSIKEFCEVHRISQEMFFKMKRAGWAPRIMKVGSRTLISTEAAAAWRREREHANDTATAA
jgi:hypothetical protein